MLRARPTDGLREPYDRLGELVATKWLAKDVNGNGFLGHGLYPGWSASQGKRNQRRLTVEEQPWPRKGAGESHSRASITFVT
jgi:hypothetical protein